MKRIIYLLLVFVLLIGCKKEDPVSTEYTVSFNTQGGSAVESLKVAKGEKIVKPQDPTKEACTFIGWFKDDTYSNAWNFEKDLVEQDMTLYACWQVGKPADVYMAATESTTLSHRVVKTYKNGIEIFSTDAQAPAYAGSMFVSGNDVYVVGSEGGDRDLIVPVMWKNGEKTVLYDESEGKAISIYVSGEDVYIAGWVDVYNSEKDDTMEVGKLWKNGKVILSTDEAVDGKFCSVYVSGNDVYVAGYETNLAKVWKNGEATLLSNGVNSALATSVFVSDNDVYAAFYETINEKGVAFFAKNGVVHQLTNGENHAIPSSICVSDGDAYIAGFESNGTNMVAKVWKNEKEILLSDGKYNAFANTIYTFDNDIYIGGNDMSKAMIWKNGDIFYEKDYSPAILDIVSIFVSK